MRPILKCNVQSGNYGTWNWIEWLKTWESYYLQYSFRKYSSTIEGQNLWLGWNQGQLTHPPPKLNTADCMQDFHTKCIILWMNPTQKWNKLFVRWSAGDCPMVHFMQFNSIIMYLEKVYWSYWYKRHKGFIPAWCWPWNKLELSTMYFLHQPSGYGTTGVWVNY